MTSWAVFSLCISFSLSLFSALWYLCVCVCVCGRLSMALGQLTPPLTSFFQARAAISTLLQTIKRVPLIDGLSAKGLRPEQSVRGEVHFNNVHFSYPSRPHIEVCRGFDLHVKEGETVALVGDSGCGKVCVMTLF